jgi:hypothetical protein
MNNIKFIYLKSKRLQIGKQKKLLHLETVEVIIYLIWYSIHTIDMNL